MQKLLLAPLVLAFAAQGAVIITFNSPGADLSGLPGQTVNWNFRISNSANYLLIDQVDYISLNNVGTFTDLFSPIAPVISPGSFADGSVAYAIDPPAPPGFLSVGQLVVTYDEFLVDPNDPSFDFDRDHVNVDPETASAAASVTVANAPEPSTLAMAVLAAAGLFVRRRRR